MRAGPVTSTTNPKSNLSNSDNGEIRNPNLEIRNKQESTKHEIQQRLLSNFEIRVLPELFFVRCRRFLGFLHDEFLEAGKLLLEPAHEIIWAVLEEDDKTEREKDEEGEPKQAADN